MLPVGGLLPDVGALTLNLKYTHKFTHYNGFEILHYFVINNKTVARVL